MAPLTFLEHWPVDHLVYLSSGAVYDGLAGSVSPATPVSPRLPYAISKLATEQYIRFFCERRHAPRSYINVRFFGAYGPYKPARKITTRWLLALAGGQREFVLRGNGENLIDFMYVDDAVDGMLRLVKAAGTSATVDFASGAPVSVNAIVAAMARTLGVEISVSHQGHTEEYIQFRSTDTAMRDRFGFAPSISFDEDCAVCPPSSITSDMPQAARHSLSERELHELVADAESHDEQYTGVVGFFNRRVRDT